MLELLPLILNSQVLSAALGAASALGVQLIPKLINAKKEKNTEKREDFKAITDSLFNEIDLLKKEVESYKEDAQNCERRYQELQSKFLDFKQKYNELELRYQIQVNINKKISAEIKKLEDQVQAHLEREQRLFNE